MEKLILSYFVFGIYYCIIKFIYITISKPDELKRILNTASSKRMRYAALITAALDVVLFWPKFLIEDIV